MRSLRGLDLRAIRRQHPDRNLQSPSRWVNDTDRTISPLRSAEDLKGHAMEWVKGVEDLDIRIFRAQGIVGVGVFIHMFIASFQPAVSPQTARVGYVHGIRFFLPVKVLSRVFRGKFVAGFEAAFTDATNFAFYGSSSHLWLIRSSFAVFLGGCFGKTGWSMPNPPSVARTQVLRYLGRYTHRIAISNHRLLAFDGERVTFLWKDYAHGASNGR